MEASFGNLGHARIRGLVCDEHDSWIGGFTGHINITTNMQVELTIICQGLKMVVKMEIERIELESNSLKAFNLIRYGDTFTHEF